jgi:hypothetical protein
VFFLKFFQILFFIVIAYFIYHAVRFLFAIKRQQRDNHRKMDQPDGEFGARKGRMRQDDKKTIELGKDQYRVD